MILKSYIVEQNFSTLNDYKEVLLYGENDGIKDDIKFDHIDLIQDITGFGGDNYLECTCLAKKKKVLLSINMLVKLVIIGYNSIKGVILA